MEERGIKMGESVSVEELQEQIENTAEPGKQKLSYDDNAELKKQEWFTQAREKFEKLGKGDVFDKTKIYLESQNKPFHEMTDDLQEQFTKLLAKNKDFMYKSEKAQLKKEVLGRIAVRMSTDANEEIVKFIAKWYKIKSIRDDSFREMYIYQDGIYTENAQTFIKELCRYCLDTLYTDTFSNKAIAKVEVDTYISYEEFTKVDNPYEIAVQNGILNIKTKELLPFTHKKIFFNKINATWNPESSCPNFEKFLLEILPTEQVKENKLMIEELIGFTLVRDYFQEKAFLFQGSGRNGKSKLLNVVETLLGSANVSNIPLEEIKYDGFQLCNLSKKLVNIGGDIGSGKLKAPQAFKSSTGRDVLAANRKGKSYIHFRNYAKMIFCANTLPETCDSSDGFYDRWEFIDFPFKFVSQDELNNASDDEKKYFKLRNPLIIDELTTEKELNGILVLAVSGLHRLLDNKIFTGNQTSAQIKEKWQARNSSFQAFMDKHLTTSEEEDFFYIEIGDFNREYEKFCLKHKCQKQTIRDIDQLMLERFGSQKDSKKISGKTRRFYPYVKFKELNHQKSLNKIN